MLRQIPFLTRFAGASAFYDVLLPDSIWLGVPSLSSGNALKDKSGYNNDGTIQGTNIQTRYNNLGNKRGMLVANGVDYVNLGVSHGLSITTHTGFGFIKLPTYSAVGTIFNAYTDANNRLYIRHTAANTVVFTHIETGTTVTTTTLLIPENELIGYQWVISGTSLNIYVFHAGGVITDSDTFAGSISGAFTDSDIGSNNGGAEFAQDGSLFSLFSLYNIAQTQLWGQARYDELIANNGVLAPQVLPLLSPIGVRTVDATYTARATSIGTLNIGVSDVELDVTSLANPTTANTSIFLRVSPNVSEKIEIEFTTAGGANVYEYDPTQTSIGSIASVEGVSLRIALVGNQLTIYKGTAVAYSVAVTLKPETIYGTHFYATVAGTHTFDLEFKDTYGKAPANDIEALACLDPDAYFKNGQLPEQFGYGDQDLTANEVYLLNGSFNFPKSDSALTIPHHTRLDGSVDDTFLRLFFETAHGFGGNNGGRLYEQSNANHADRASFINVNVDYVTTDARSKASNSATLGQSNIIVAGLNGTTDTLSIHSNTNEESLSIETAGVGGVVSDTNDIIVGNRSASGRGYYGTMLSFLFLHQLSTDSLMRYLQVHLRIRQYYQDSINILQADARYIADNDDFWETVANVSASASGNSAGTVLSPYGAYGTIGYFDISAFLPATLSSISGVFNIELDLTDAVNTLLYIESGTDFIHLFTTATVLTLRYYDGSNNDASYTLSGMSLADGDNCEVVYNVSASGLELWINGIQVATDATAFVAFTSYDTNLAVIGAANSSTGTTSYDKLIYQAPLRANNVLTAIDIMRHYNLISANGAEWYDWLNTTYTMTKLNNSEGGDLLASGGSADTLSVATADAGYAPNGEVYIDFATAPSHLNIGATALTMNDKRYTIWVQPKANTVSTTLCYLFRLYIDASNYLDVYFSTTAAQLVVDYRAGGTTNQMTYDTAVALTNYWLEIDIPASGETAELFINGTSEATVVLTNDISGTALSDANTVVGAISTSNTSHLQGWATNLQIGEKPADGLSDIDNARGTAL